MRRSWKTQAVAAGLGAVSGMRTLTGLAVVSRQLTSRQSRGSVISVLQSPKVRIPLTVLAAGELVLDKAPVVGNRTDPPGLFGRASLGALCGVAVADYLGTGKAAAAAVGAGSAVASTFITYRARKAAGRHLPDWIVAAAEDTGALAAARSLSNVLTDRK